jgi:hypothetical protein
MSKTTLNAADLNIDEDPLSRHNPEDPTVLSRLLPPAFALKAFPTPLGARSVKRASRAASVSTGSLGLTHTIMRPSGAGLPSLSAL